MSQSNENQQASETNEASLPPHTVTLHRPIKRGETEIKTVSLREPKAGDLRGLQMLDVMRLDVTSLSSLLPRISSPTLTSHEVMSLALSDLSALSLELMGFFEPPETATA